MRRSQLDLTKEDPYVDYLTFPDGQPHLSIRAVSDPVDLHARIASSDDLVRLLLAQDILQAGFRQTVDLHLAFVMGGRMDRAIPASSGKLHPFTLKVVADCIKTAGFNSISVFDPHSDVTPALLNARPWLPTQQLRHVLARLPDDTVLVAPDVGAAKRVEAMGKKLEHPVIQAYKKRDMATGKLSGFGVIRDDYDDMEGPWWEGRTCLIVDDICDGGRTFAGIAKALSPWAAAVHLYVSHGIFSKRPDPFDIEGISRIWTTNSYQNFDVVPDHVQVLPWLM